MASLEWLNKGREDNMTDEDNSLLTAAKSAARSSNSKKSTKVFSSTPARGEDAQDMSNESETPIPSPPNLRSNARFVANLLFTSTASSPLRVSDSDGRMFHPSPLRAKDDETSSIVISEASSSLFPDPPKNRKYFTNDGYQDKSSQDHAVKRVTASKLEKSDTFQEIRENADGCRAFACDGGGGGGGFCSQMLHHTESCDAADSDIFSIDYRVDLSDQMHPVVKDYSAGAHSSASSVGLNDKAMNTWLDTKMTPPRDSSSRDPNREDSPFDECEWDINAPRPHNHRFHHHISKTASVESDSIMQSTILSHDSEMSQKIVKQQRALLLKAKQMGQNIAQKEQEVIYLDVSSSAVEQVVCGSINHTNLYKDLGLKRDSPTQMQQIRSPSIDQVVTPKKESPSYEITGGFSPRAVVEWVVSYFNCGNLKQVHEQDDKENSAVRKTKRPTSETPTSHATDASSIKYGLVGPPSIERKREGRQSVYLHSHTSKRTAPPPSRKIPAPSRDTAKKPDSPGEISFRHNLSRSTNREITDDGVSSVGSESASRILMTVSMKKSTLNRETSSATQVRSNTTGTHSTRVSSKHALV